MIAGEQKAPPAPVAAGKLVDPGNGIFVGLVCSLGEIEKTLLDGAESDSSEDFS